MRRVLLLIETGTISGGVQAQITMSEEGGWVGEFSVAVCTVMDKVATFQVSFLVAPETRIVASFEVAICNGAGVPPARPLFTL